MATVGHASSTSVQVVDSTASAEPRTPNGGLRRQPATDDLRHANVHDATNPNGVLLASPSTQLRIQATAEDQKAYVRGSQKYKHTFAVHSESRPSLFSVDNKISPSSTGFRNLMGLIIVISNMRLMMDNFKKYGILVTLSGSNVADSDWFWFTTLYLMTPCHLFVAYGIEQAAMGYAKSITAQIKREGEDQRERILADDKARNESWFSTWKFIAVAHALNVTSMLAFSSYIVYYNIHNPGLGTVTELHSVIVWLKVFSYALTNRDLRHAYLRADPATDLPGMFKTCPYPNNITMRNLCYFWWAPTLVYQPVYARSNKRRYDFIAKRFFECILLCVVIWITCAQYAVPLLHNSVDDISKLRGFNILERVMKLSTISLVCWLAGFFALFQSFLNFLAEVMMFGDREFYGDWWNSSDLRGYWTSWNKPVSHFMKRHIYSPLVGRGMNPILAQICVFLFSGALHEAVVGLPTHNILMVAFWGMVGQIPLIILTDLMKKVFGNGHNAKLAGNLIFWLTFCIFGQPLAAMAYFFAWQAKYGDAATRPAWPQVKLR